MTKLEIKTAIKLIQSRIDRSETIIDGDGQSLTVYWIEGGQKLFTSLDQVKNHIQSH